MARIRTADPQEIANFSKDAGSWWDENGPFRPLHRLNPARLDYLRRRIVAHFGPKKSDLKPFAGLKILDIGCGGGLICEPLARLGAAVTGIDADPKAVSVARQHAGESGLDIQCRCADAETLPEAEKYDVVLGLEIIEHVTDPEFFVRMCVNLCRPGGLVIFSTLNRTPKSYALGILAAEYLLRWVPRGTHTWQKFVRPSELARYVRASGAQPINVTGLVYDPLRQNFSLSETDMDVNYFLSAHRP